MGLPDAPFLSRRIVPIALQRRQAKSLARDYVVCRFYVPVVLAAINSISCSGWTHEQYNNTKQTSPPPLFYYSLVSVGLCF